LTENKRQIQRQKESERARENNTELPARYPKPSTDGLNTTTCPNAKPHYRKWLKQRHSFLAKTVHLTFFLMHEAQNDTLKKKLPCCFFFCIQ